MSMPHLAVYGPAPRPRRPARAGAPAGFTLIEVLIVMTIIVVLAGIAMAVHTTALTRSKEAVLREDLRIMRDAIDQYYADKGKYPESLEALVSESYIRQVPQDPFTNSTTTWQTVQAEATPGTVSTSPGIYDVKSGSDMTAMDGSRYADW